MDFLRRLIGGGQPSSGRSQSGDPDGIYYYVQPRGCAEVVRVRINRNNDLSQRDEGGYWVHKVVRGVQCFQNVELDLYFDNNRKLTETEVSGGTLVDEAAYAAWVASQPSKTP